MKVRLEWFGPDLLRRIKGAEESAIHKTLDRAASAASAGRRTKRRTGKLQIQKFDVRRSGNGVVGDFGYTQGYGFFHEVGFRGRAGDHTLRRAGDREFTKLATDLRSEAGIS